MTDLLIGYATVAGLLWLGAALSWAFLRSVDEPDDARVAARIAKWALLWPVLLIMLARRMNEDGRS